VLMENSQGYSLFFAHGQAPGHLRGSDVDKAPPPVKLLP
jgi:hypothetical protein